MNTLILIFYKIAAFFTRVTSKTRQPHNELRAEKIGYVASSSGSNINESSADLYINQQDNLSDIPYGKTDMSFGGCGPIALYNALISLNIVPNMEEILKFLENNGAAFGAKFGTSPYAIRKFLVNKGVSVKSCSSANPSKLNSFAKNYNTFITIIFNNSKSIFQGLHFICTVKDDKGVYTTHNPLTTADSLFGALSSCSKSNIRNIYTIGIRKKLSHN